MAEPQVQSQPRSRNTVWVQNKLPWGVDLFLDQEGTDEQTGKPIRVPRLDTRVRLNGANSAKIIGGYGMTEIDADFWNEWVKTHRNFEPLRSGAIKAQPTRERAFAQAVDEKELKTKLEPIDPDKPGEGLTRVSDRDVTAAQALSA